MHLDGPKSFLDDFLFCFSNASLQQRRFSAAFSIPEELFFEKNDIDCFSAAQLRVLIIPYRLAVRIPAIGGGLHVLFEFPGFFRCHGRSRIGIDTMVRWLTTLFTNR